MCMTPFGGIRTIDEGVYAGDYGYRYKGQDSEANVEDELEENARLGIFMGRQ